MLPERLLHMLLQRMALLGMASVGWLQLLQGNVTVFAPRIFQFLIS